MIFSVFVVLDSFFLILNGKIDCKVLLVLEGILLE